MTSPMNPNLPADLPPIGLRRVVYLEANRAPLVTDTKYRNGSYYENNTEWRNNATSPPEIWKLAKVNSKVNATWFLISSAFSAGVASLSGDNDVIVTPDPGTGNIKLTGTPGQITVTEDPVTYKLTWALDTGQLFDSVMVDAATVPGVNPVVPDSNGLMTIGGATKTAGTTPVRTHTTAVNQYDIEVQISQAIASTDATKIGLAAFDSTIFTTDANGFVSLVGGAVPAPQKFDVQAHTAPGTDPVVATALGVVTINGTVVANQSIPIQTDSLAANTLNIEAQYATVTAALDGDKVGFAAFNSAQFQDSGSGFISLKGSTVAAPILGITPDTGTSPVVADATGLIRIQGSTPATSNTRGIRTTGATNELDISMFSPYTLGDFAFQSTTGGTTRTLTVENTVDAASSAANIVAKVAGATSADPQTTYTITGVTTFSTGIDNSDTDRYKISRSATLGTSDVISVYSTYGVKFFEDIAVGIGNAVVDPQPSTVGNLNVINILDDSSVNRNFNIQISTNNGTSGQAGTITICGATSGVFGVWGTSNTDSTHLAGKAAISSPNTAISCNLGGANYQYSNGTEIGRFRIDSSTNHGGLYMVPGNFNGVNGFNINDNNSGSYFSIANTANATLLNLTTDCCWMWYAWSHGDSSKNGMAFVVVGGGAAGTVNAVVSNGLTFNFSGATLRCNNGTGGDLTDVLITAIRIY